MRREKDRKAKKSRDNSPSRTLNFFSPKASLKSPSTDSGEDTDSVAPSPGLASAKHCNTPQILANVLGSMAGDKLAYPNNVKQTLVQQFGTHFTELGWI